MLQDVSYTECVVSAASCKNLLSATTMLSTFLDDDLAKRTYRCCTPTFETQYRKLSLIVTLLLHLSPC